MRVAVAAIAGFAIPAAGGPVTTSAGYPLNGAAVSRDMLPAGQQQTRRRRRGASHVGQRSFSYDGALRRTIERGIGGRLSGRQWARVRRYLARAHRLHEAAEFSRLPMIDRRVQGAIIPRRLQPMFRQTDRGLVLFGVHPQGVAAVADSRRVFGIPWKWLEGLT
jgi:hypothetical protein